MKNKRAGCSYRESEKEGHPENIFLFSCVLDSLCPVDVKMGKIPLALDSIALLFCQPEGSQGNDHGKDNEKNIHRTQISVEIWRGEGTMLSVVIWI